MNAKERILTAAEEIFLEGGFDGVSIRELTDAAGVNIALVNYYFGGKRNLYLEVLQRKFTAVAKCKCALLRQAISPQQNPDLRYIITTYVLLHLDSDETVLASQQFLRLVSRQLADDDDAMELLLQKLILPIHQLAKDFIGQACPQFSKEDISLCIGSITGQIFHFLRFPKAFQAMIDPTETDNLREKMVSHIIEFSLRGINKETACDSTR